MGNITRKTRACHHDRREGSGVKEMSLPPAGAERPGGGLRPGVAGGALGGRTTAGKTCREAHCQNGGRDRDKAYKEGKRAQLVAEKQGSASKPRPRDGCRLGRGQDVHWAAGRAPPGVLVGGRCGGRSGAIVTERRRAGVDRGPADGDGSQPMFPPTHSHARMAHCLEENPGPGVT